MLQHISSSLSMMNHSLDSRPSSASADSTQSSESFESSESSESFKTDYKSTREPAAKAIKSDQSCYSRVGRRIAPQTEKEPLKAEIAKVRIQQHQ
jgi:hypothetical protein